MTKIQEWRNNEWQPENELLTSVKPTNPEELKIMASEIFKNGKITKHEFISQDVFTVEKDGLPIKYIIKINNLKVEEIIEIIG